MKHQIIILCQDLKDLLKTPLKKSEFMVGKGKIKVIEDSHLFDDILEFWKHNKDRERG